MNTAIVSPTGARVGIGFATPTAIVAPIVDQIPRYGEARRGWLGVQAFERAWRRWRKAPGSEEAGAIITRITPGGPGNSGPSP